MKKLKSKVTRVLAGCLATFVALGSGVLPGGVLNVRAERYPHLYDTFKIDSAHFPDPVFLQYVKDAYDQNRDGKLDNDEIIEARTIRCDKMGISTLKGIKYLPELRGIYCSFNNLTELDIKDNQLITGIWVSNNNFTKLDFSKNPGLEWLYCFDCPKLTSLNVTGNPLMSYLEVNTCPLGSIDVSHNPLLEQLTCASCNLTKLDISKNHKLTHLDCQVNDISYLALDKTPAMKRLDCWMNSGLANLDVSCLPHLQYYNCAKNNITKLDLSKNTELVKLNCGWNNLKSLDLSHNPKLYSLSCNDNQLTSLDLSNAPDLQFLMAYINDFNTLDIGNNPKLMDCIDKGTYKFEPNAASHSYTIDYGIDDSYAGLDSKYFFCVDDRVNVTRNAAAQVSTEVYFEGDIADTSQYLTREMVAQTLYELAGSPSVDGLTSRFTDVEQGSWYYAALLWGEANNVTVGFPDMASDTFGVGKWCTKQDMAFMVMQWALYMGYERSIDFGRSDDYIDYFEVSYKDWEAVCWACTYRSFPTEGDRNADKSQQYIKPFKVVSRDDLTYFIQGIQEENGVAISSSLPMPSASYVPANIETHGRGPGNYLINTPVDLSQWNDDIDDGSAFEQAGKQAEAATGGSGSASGTGAAATGGAAAGSGAAAGGSTSGGSSKTGKWVQADNGQYNFVTDDGNKETNCYRDGCWLDENGNYNPAYSNGTWKCNSTGWWYEDNGWYPYSQWLKIDGYWYYFCDDGYMDYSEYRDGCWLESGGNWNEAYSLGQWHVNSTGWWYSDGDWYPYSQYLWIDGTCYHFDGDGYWDK